MKIFQYLFKFTSNFLHCIYIYVYCSEYSQGEINNKRKTGRRHGQRTGTIHSLQLFAKYAVQLFMCQRCFISLCTFAVYRWTPTNLVAFKLEEYFWAFVEISAVFFPCIPFKLESTVFFHHPCALDSHGFQNDIAFALKMSILCCYIQAFFVVYTVKNYAYIIIQAF